MIRIPLHKMADPLNQVQDLLDRIERQKKKSLKNVDSGSSQEIGATATEHPSNQTLNYTPIESSVAHDQQDLTPFQSVPSTMNEDDDLIPDTPSPEFGRLLSKKKKLNTQVFYDSDSSPVFPSVRPKHAGNGARSRASRRSRSASPTGAAAILGLSRGLNYDEPWCEHPSRSSKHKLKLEQQDKDVCEQKCLRSADADADVIPPSKRHRVAKSDAMRRLKLKVNMKKKRKKSSSSYFHTDDQGDLVLGDMTLSPRGNDATPLLPPLSDHLQPMDNQTSSLTCEKKKLKESKPSYQPFRPLDLSTDSDLEDFDCLNTGGAVGGQHRTAQQSEGATIVGRQPVSSRTNNPSIVDLTSADTDSSDIGEEEWEEFFSDIANGAPQPVRPSFDTSQTWNVGFEPDDMLITLSGIDEPRPQSTTQTFRTPRKKSHSNPPTVRSRTVRQWATPRSNDANRTSRIRRSCQLDTGIDTNDLGCHQHSAPRSDVPIPCSHMSCRHCCKRPLSTRSRDHKSQKTRKLSRGTRLAGTTQATVATLSATDPVVTEGRRERSFHRNIPNDSDEDNRNKSLSPSKRQKLSQTSGRECEKQMARELTSHSDSHLDLSQHSTLVHTMSAPLFPALDQSLASPRPDNHRQGHYNRHCRRGDRFFTNLGLQTPGSITSVPWRAEESNQFSPLMPEPATNTSLPSHSLSEAQSQDSSVLVLPSSGGGGSSRASFTIGGQRRRQRKSRTGGHTETEAAVATDVGEVSSSTGAGPTEDQLASDEALARRLQEEMDLEYATSLVSPSGVYLMASGGADRHSRTRATNPQHALAGLDPELALRQRIESLPEYKRLVRHAIVSGLDFPEPPRNAARRSVDQIVDPQIIEHMERNMSRGRPVNNDAPLGADTRWRTPHSHRHRARQVNRVGGRAVNEDIPLVANRRWHTPHRTTQPPPRRRRTRVGWNAETLHMQHEVDALMGSFGNILETDGIVARHRQGRNRGGVPLMPPFHALFDGADYDQLWELADRLGDVKSLGLKPEQITMLPVKTFKMADLKAGSEVPECHVCMSEYEETDSLRILPCFHEYHVDCIDRWLKNNATCPVCRAQVKID